jgi:hypothetical protein
MIECENEKCGRYFHADDIQQCPECGKELCEDCFQKHVKGCLNKGNLDEEY